MSVEAMAFAVPEVCETAAKVARQTGVSEQFLIEKVGLKTRYILAPNDTGVESAAKACERLFERTSLVPK